MSKSNTKDDTVNWLEVADKYFKIKQIYIECEETDPELKTNLQPMNEFKAALDHTMRIIGKETGFFGDNISLDLNGEQKKLLSHLKRAFFDICDMLSINYRNKIVDMLGIYSPNQIGRVLPDYYAKERIRIEQINVEISNFRNKKGQDPANENERMDEYFQSVIELKEYFIKYQSAIPALEELRKAEEEIACTQDKKERKKWLIPLIITSAISVVSTISAIVLAII